TMVLFSQESISQTPSPTRYALVNQSILNHNPMSMDPDIRKYKMKAMQYSSFTFYRATAHLFFEDYQSGFIKVPQELKNKESISWIQGDFHLHNAGFFEVDQKVVFHLNDFDESYLSFYYLDLLRLISSIYLLDDLLIEKSDAEDLDKVAKKFLLTYIDNFKLENIESLKLPKQLKKLKKKLLRKKSQLALLDKWTLVSKDKRSFNFQLKKLAKVDKDRRVHLMAALSKEHRVIDIAQRLYSGLGSLGVEKYYFLVEDVSNLADKTKVYELKQQITPICIQDEQSKKIYKQTTKSHALRAKVATDYLLSFDSNYQTLEVRDKSYGIKEISPYKGGVYAFKSVKDLKSYCKYLAHLLAQSHLDSTKNDANLDSYKFYKSVHKILVQKKYQNLILDLAKSYARQVNDDFKSFKHHQLHEN
ncbi:DUF2252 domain-containing protein, partial [bacterium]|nr:DUF2252 domain-containing protein [bacterium]